MIDILDLYSDISDVCDQKNTFVVSNCETSKDIATFSTDFFLVAV